MPSAESRISVIGAGYVGIVTGACLAELGHGVICVEADDRRLASLRRGEVPIYEPGLGALVERNRRAGRLDFTGDHAMALRQADFAFVAVNTPPCPDGRADTSAVRAAVEAIAG